MPLRFLQARRFWTTTVTIDAKRIQSRGHAILLRGSRTGAMLIFPTIRYPNILSMCLAVLAASMLTLWDRPVLAQQQQLILGVHPYLQQAKLKKRFKPLARYLSDQLGIPVEVRVGQSYQAHLEAIGKDNIDIAYLGPALYVKTLAQYGDKPLLARLESKGSPTFRGHIVVSKNSPIRTLADLKGKVFAFGDPSSTMSSLVPRAMLLRAGITLQDLEAYHHHKGHTNVALAVLAGDADAGAVKEEVYTRFQPRGLRSLRATPAISEHVFVARADLDPALVRQLQQLLLGIRAPQQVGTILKPIKKTATGLVPASPLNYENLRQLMESLGE